MFTIRREQEKAMLRALNRDFILRAAAHLKRVFPEKCGLWNEDVLGSFVADSLEPARRYGLVSEYQVLCFIDMRMLLGPEFDCPSGDAEARAILLSQSDGNAKTQALYSRARRAPVPVGVV